MNAQDRKQKVKNIFRYKRLILAAVLPFVFWGALIALWFFKAPTQNEPYVKISKTNNENTAFAGISIIDSDQDGLSNWEEGIYGTDPNNPDTDGDSYLDGEEVISGRDPLKKGPNDILVKKFGPEPQIKTTTDAFAQLALKNFLNNAPDGNIMDIPPEELDAKLKDALKNDPALEREFQEEMRRALYEYIPEGLDAKIKSSNKSGDEATKQYLDQFIKIASESSNKYGSFKLSQIISDAYVKKDYRKIDGAISYYNAVYANLLSTSTPKDLLSLHRDVLLLFYETAKILEATKNWEADSVRGLIAIRKYSAWINKLENWNANSADAQNL